MRVRRFKIIPGERSWTWEIENDDDDDDDDDFMPADSRLMRTLSDCKYKFSLQCNSFRLKKSRPKFASSPICHL